MRDTSWKMMKKFMFQKIHKNCIKSIYLIRVIVWYISGIQEMRLTIKMRCFKLLVCGFSVKQRLAVIHFSKFRVYIAIKPVNCNIDNSQEFIDTIYYNSGQFASARTLLL